MRKSGDLKHLSVHQWIRSAITGSQQPISPIGFLFLKLPPPPCAVLLVHVEFFPHILSHFDTFSFPTCQVRVVRFYQSCCPPPPPPPPPPVSPRPCLHQLPPPLRPCQLFAKLFANFRAQCALLDSQLSAHRWASTWDLPSPVRTAGPQPGTFPAQCAPLDLNLGPSQLSAHRWTSTWDLPSSARTAGPQPGTFLAQCAPLDLKSQIECQKICQKICQIECQKECQKIC